MSRKYKFHNPEGLYFVSFAIVHWIDVFTRREYQEILLESLRFCQENKGMVLFVWCIMTNHVHLIMRGEEGHKPEHIMRDMKKFTSSRLIKAIEENPTESRQEWMLRAFKKAGKENSNNSNFQACLERSREIRDKTTNRSSYFQTKS